MPEWTRHLMFAVLMAAAVIVGTVVLVQWGLEPLSTSPAMADSAAARLLLTVVGVGL